jgi:hypothetical protein
MPSQPPIRRSNPPQKTNYKEYKEELRSDFFNSCAYCGIMEIESAGVGFSIDHYIPKESPEGKPLEHAFLNLLLSCDDCNSYKGKYFASAIQKDLGQVIIRPDEMIPSDHIMLDENDLCELASKTKTGVFNIEKLDLNRPGLKRIRAARHQCYQAQEIIEQGIKALSSVALDNLEPAQKARLIKLRHDILKIKDRFSEDVDKLLADYARSPLRFPDPDGKARTRARRKKLKELGKNGPG